MVFSQAGYQAVATVSTPSIVPRPGKEPVEPVEAGSEVVAVDVESVERTADVGEGVATVAASGFVDAGRGVEESLSEQAGAADTLQAVSSVNVANKSESDEIRDRGILCVVIVVTGNGNVEVCGEDGG